MRIIEPSELILNKDGSVFHLHMVTILVSTFKFQSKTADQDYLSTTYAYHILNRVKVQT